MAVSKPLLTKFGINHRLESCVGFSLQEHCSLCCLNVACKILESSQFLELKPTPVIVVNVYESCYESFPQKFL